MPQSKTGLQDFKEWADRNQQTQAGKQQTGTEKQQAEATKQEPQRSSAWKRLDAEAIGLVRQGREDLWNNVIPAFPDSARLTREQGAPGSPTPAITTADLLGQEVNFSPDTVQITANQNAGEKTATVGAKPRVEDQVNFRVESVQQPSLREMFGEDLKGLPKEVAQEVMKAVYGHAQNVPEIDGHDHEVVSNIKRELERGGRE